MAKLDNLSAEQMSASLDLFTCKPTLVGLEHSCLVEYPTLTPITDGPIHFRINTGSFFADFSKSFLVTTFRVTKKEGDKYVNIDKNDPVSLINSFGATFIQNMKVMFNHRAVYTDDLYAYNAYMKRRLGIGGSTTLHELQAAGYFEDELSQMSGPGFEARRSLYTNGRTFKAATPLDVGIFQQNKYFLDGMSIDIEIRPNSSAFTLISTGTKEYKYEVLDCKLMVKQYYLNSDLYNAIQETLNKGVFAKYNYTRNVMKKFFIAPGTYDFETIMFQDQLPKRIFAGLVDAKAFHGHVGMSPFEFAPHDLESIQVCANGIRVPNAPYKLEWKANNFIHPYMDLSKMTPHNISLPKYTAHSAFYGFDLKLEQDHGHTEAQRLGTTSVTLKFSAQVPDDGLQLMHYVLFFTLLLFEKCMLLAT